MTALTALPATPTPGFRLRQILLAGLAGGAVDLVYASAAGAVRGRSVAQVWQGVASGWLGRAAYDGGAASVALGVATHFAIATLMAGAYAAAAARAPVLIRRWPLFAPAYGLLLYGLMYRVVLPLRWPGAGAWQGTLSLLDVAAHVGLALAAASVLARSALPDRRGAGGG